MKYTRPISSDVLCIEGIIVILIFLIGLAIFA